MEAGFNDVFYRLFRDKLCHAIVDATTCQNHLGYVTDHIRFVCEIVRVYTDAVSPDQAGAEGEEIPLGTGSLQDLQRINSQLIKDECQLVHQRDIQVALGILDHFCGFCYFDAGGAVHTGGDNGFV